MSPERFRRKPAFAGQAWTSSPSRSCPANDLDATLSFYERLGFKNAGSAPTEWNYLIIRRGSVLDFYGDPQVDPLTTSSAAPCTQKTPMLSSTSGTRSG